MNKNMQDPKVKELEELKVKMAPLGLTWNPESGFFERESEFDWMRDCLDLEDAHYLLSGETLSFAVKDEEAFEGARRMAEAFGVFIERLESCPCLSIHLKVYALSDQALYIFQEEMKEIG